MYFNELQPTILIKPIWNYSSTVAWAAANLAIGTLNGEQLT